jgi:hypothetical protein
MPPTCSISLQSVSSGRAMEITRRCVLNAHTYENIAAISVSRF